ncbi:MAG: type II toxin-antitoxin system HicB family antitoxin [Nanoarchaeota archaeon]
MEYNIIIEKDEDGWLVSEVVELQGCHTQAKSMDELIKRTKEAIQVCLESEKPNFIISNKFIGIQKIEV